MVGNSKSGGLRNNSVCKGKLLKGQLTMDGAKAVAKSKKRASTASVADGKENKKKKETNAEAEEKSKQRRETPAAEKGVKNTQAV